MLDIVPLCKCHLTNFLTAVIPILAHVLIPTGVVVDSVHGSNLNLKVPLEFLKIYSLAVIP